MLAMLMLVVMQTVPGPPGEEEATVPRVTQPRHCVRKSDEIVVCGGGGDSQRLMPLPEPGTRMIFKPAAVQISPNKRVGLHAANSSNPTVSAPRAMVDLTIKF
jgi:hypothetical protein